MEQKNLEYRLIRLFIEDAAYVRTCIDSGINHEMLFYRASDEPRSFTSELLRLALRYFESSNGCLLQNTTVELELSKSDLPQETVLGLLSTWKAIRKLIVDDNELPSLIDEIKERYKLRLYGEMIEQGHAALTEGGLDKGLEVHSNYLNQINALDQPQSREQKHLYMHDAAEYFDKEVAERRSRGINSGVFFGLPEIDRVTLGLQPGEMIMFVTESSGGKSLTLLNAAAHAYHREKKSVIYFSVEMGVWMCMLRHLSWFCDIEHNLLRGLSFNDMQQRNIMHKLNSLEGEAYFAYEYFEHDMTAEYVIQRIKAIEKECGKPDLVVIDYIGKMSSRDAPRNAAPHEKNSLANTLLKADAGNRGYVYATAQQQGKASITEKRKNSNFKVGQDMIAGSHTLVADSTYTIYMESNKETCEIVYQPIKIRQGGWFTPFMCNVQPQYNRIRPLNDSDLRAWREIQGYPVGKVTTDQEMRHAAQISVIDETAEEPVVSVRGQEVAVNRDDLDFDNPVEW